MVEKIVEWGEEINLPCRRIQNNLYRYSTLKLFLPKCMVWKVVRSNLPVEKPDKHYLGWSRPTSTVLNYVDSIYAWSDVIKMAVYLCGLPPNNTSPQYHEKDNRQIPIVGHSTKYLTSTSQNWSSKPGKVWETVTAKRSLRRLDD